MVVLGIESSCDETACGIVRDGVKVLASVVTSQIPIHRKFGGVVPEVASRQHLLLIDQVVEEALSKANLSLDQVDAIAVTQGPGLIGALLVGISYAKGLASSLNVPLVPIDHVHAHVHGALLEAEPISYPCLALVVSGGHTNLYYMEGPCEFELIARSIDDACGECFDKVAKLMGMPYPGGAKIEAQANQSKDRVEVSMPRMVEEKSRLEFSYSGLKTHMVNLLRKHEESWIKEYQPEICKAFQKEALGQIVRKLKIANERYPEAKSVLIAGGVSANKTFRTMLDAALEIPVTFPKLEYCSDNGAMIAGYGYHCWTKNNNPEAWLWSKDWDAYARYKF